MGRLVVLIIAVLVLLWLVRRALRGRSSGEARDTAVSAPVLVRCAHCATHVPAEDAVQRDAQFFCSEAHARLGASTGRE